MVFFSFHFLPFSYSAYAKKGIYGICIFDLGAKHLLSISTFPFEELSESLTSFSDGWSLHSDAWPFGSIPGGKVYSASSLVGLS